MNSVIIKNHNYFTWFIINQAQSLKIQNIFYTCLHAFYNSKIEYNSSSMKTIMEMMGVEKILNINKDIKNHNLYFGVDIIEIIRVILTCRLPIRKFFMKVDRVVILQR